MAEKVEILCVDDEPQVVEGLKDLLEDRYQVHTATGGESALQLLGRRPQIAVIMSDMRMPVMDGAAFLQETRTVAPDAVRMLLTGYSDMNAAIAVVNRGQVFRFLTKPCTPDDVSRAFESAVAQHRLITAERVLLQQTLLGCLKSLLGVLSLIDPIAFGRAQRLKRIVRAIAQEWGLQPSWAVEAAALLSQLGCIDLPHAVVMKLYSGGPLDDADRREVHAGFETVCGLLASVPRLEPVVEIIGALSEPAGPVGAQMLRIAMDFDSLEACGYSAKDIAISMKAWVDRYDSKLLEAAIKACCRPQPWGAVRDVSPDQLRSGAFVAEDIRKADGVLIVPRGVELTSNVIAHIARFRGELEKATVRVSSRQPDQSSPALASAGA